MESNYKRLGDFIRQVDIRNKDLSVSNLLGVSIEKKFIPSIANTIGTDMTSYKIVKKGQFAYGTVTSRNGDKVSIALLDEVEECIISSAYLVFEITKPQELDSNYLMLLFKNPEFDRYARYNSWGSAREVFSWEEMCNTEFIIPNISKQKRIVNQYKSIENMIHTLDKQILCNERLLKEIYKDFKSNCKSTDIQPLTSVVEWIGGSQPPKNKFIYSKQEGYVRLIQNRDYTNDKYITYIPVSNTNKYCDELDIMIDKYGDAGKTRYGLSGAYNVALSKIKPKLENSREYIRCFLNDEEIYQYLNEASMASTRSSLNEKTISGIKIKIPSIEELAKFEKQASNIVKHNLNLTKLKKQLEKLLVYTLN